MATLSSICIASTREFYGMGAWRSHGAAPDREAAMPTATKHELDAHQIRAIAVAAAVDPRSVEKWLALEPLRSSVANRIRRAIRTLARRGVIPPLERD